MKLYYNGELSLETNTPLSLPRDKRNKKKEIVHTMILGRKDELRTLPSYGKFKIAHLAIWKNILSQDELRKVYKANVRIDGDIELCCYYLQSM